jgi:hypothetical protein
MAFLRRNRKNSPAAKASLIALMWQYRDAGAGAYRIFG